MTVIIHINIIQSKCRSPNFSGVYDPIPAKFCEQVGLNYKTEVSVIYLVRRELPGGMYVFLV